MTMAGSTCVSPAMVHAGGVIRGNLCSSPRLVSKHGLNSSIYSSTNNKASCNIVASKRSGVSFMGGCSHGLHHQEVHSALSSSSSPVFSPSAPVLVPSSSTLMRKCGPIEAIQSSTSKATTEKIGKSSESGEAGAAPILNVSERWREIHGEKHWEGLLDHPIDAALRSEIIRYGEFAQVCYDAFDYERHSLYCGSCKYSRKTLFEKVDKGACGYEVTKYLYATSDLDLPKFLRMSEREEELRWSGNSNWIGYVAVSTDEESTRRLGRRDILVAWRGTITKTEWIDDMMTTQSTANMEEEEKRWAAASKEVKVESGFLSLYKSSKASSRFNKLSAGQQMAMEVKRLLQKYEGEEVSISITGHSLGAAIALLCAYDIAANIVQGAAAADNNNPLITLFSFAGPRVGNKAFKERVEQLGVRVLRIVNVHDGVPKVPGVLFNENASFISKVWPISNVYYHVGKELVIDMDVSPHLRRSRDLGDHHNLEAYLHVLDGFHGVTHPFQSVFNRNHILVNKSSGFLKEETLIPASWWQDHNKGLVRDSSGQWVIAPRDEEHLPEIHHP
eukprot:c23002_g1_i1 orf=85-1764(-)